MYVNTYQFKIGGTDIVSLFAGHNSAEPVYRGEIQCRCLGMKVEAWDDNGNALFDVPGDLVCSKPFPVMPVMMWNDPGNEKYKNAYFSKYDGHVWYHGDYVLINSKTGGVKMLGRSDGTLNVFIFYLYIVIIISLLACRSSIWKCGALQYHDLIFSSCR